MKKILGWIGIILLSILPAIAWYAFGPARTYPLDYTNVTHFIGQVTGLVGMTMFAFTFVLSTRWTIFEDIFGGLDKVYQVHKTLGVIALILLLFHPIFLILKFLPDQMNRAAEYLTLSAFQSVNYGLFALLGMIMLIFITFYISMRYHVWKWTHKTMGIFFILAVLHIFLVRGDVARDNIFDGYYIFAIIVSAIGISAYIYSLLLKGMKSALYKVESIRIKGNVHDILLTPLSGSITAKAGQFLFFSFYSSKISHESHPFSIAGIDKGKIRVIIKTLGDFTSTISRVKQGDKVKVEGPYGRFYSRNPKQTWIAGGIGITPFLSLAAELPTSADIDLYYSVAEARDLVGLDDFEDVQRKSKGRFRVHPWISAEKGRLTIDSIAGPYKGRDFFLCGPEGLKDSITRGLISKGVMRRNIHDEVFQFK
jgi:predicted ferric reductase